MVKWLASPGKPSIASSVCFQRTTPTTNRDALNDVDAFRHFGIVHASHHQSSRLSKQLDRRLPSERSALHRHLQGASMLQNEDITL
jgi:hypothetical protein